MGGIAWPVRPWGHCLRVEQILHCRLRYEAMDRPPFVGRDDATRALSNAYDDVDINMVVITGEAGIGKTRLIREFVRDRSIRTVEVECFLLASYPVAFSILARALDLISEPSDEEPDASTISARLRQFERWLSGLVTQAADKRVMVVIDDAQWADETTLAFITYLAHVARADDLLTVVTLRSEQGASAPASLVDVMRHGRTRTLPLARLNPHDARELAGLLGARSADRAEVARRGEGNPYLIGELVAGQGLLPTHVEELFLLRTRTLGADARALLDLASVAGPRVSDSLLSAVLDWERARYSAAVREVLGSGTLLQDGDGYVFAHSLAREALLEQMLAIDRQATHRAIAMVLEKHGVSAATSSALALHWYAAGDVKHSRMAALRAARDAFAGNAFDVAWAHYRHALTLAGDPPDGVESVSGAILAAASEAARWAGDSRAARQLAERGARSAVDPFERAAFLEQLGRCLWEDGRGPESTRILELALGSVGDVPPSLAREKATAAITAALARNAMVGSRYAEAAEQAGRALILACATGSRRVEADALITMGAARALSGTSDSVPVLRRGLDIARDLDDREAICRAHSNLVFVLDLVGQVAACTQAATEGLEYLRACGLELGVSAMFVNNAVAVLIDRGRLIEADRLLTDVLEAAPSAQGLPRALWLDRARLALLRGDVPAARAAADQVAGLDIEDDAWVAVAAAVVRARLAALDGAIDTALELLQRVSAYSAEDPALVAQLWRVALEIAADAGRRTDFAERLPTFSPADAVNLRAEWTTAVAESHRAEGVDDPVEWGAACALWIESDRPYDVAYCRYRQAAALVSRRIPEAASEAAADARDIARAIGAANLVDGIEDLQRRARLAVSVRSHRASVVADPRDPLTGRETDVFDLLARGATNREIAGTLFISERTAEVHVSRVLRKLGVHGRAQVAALATTIGGSNASRARNR